MTGNNYLPDSSCDALILPKLLTTLRVLWEWSPRWGLYSASCSPYRISSVIIRVSWVNKSDTRINHMFDFGPVLSWFVKSCKSCFPFSCNLFVVFKQALKSDLVKCPHWLGKRCGLEKKTVWFVNKSHHWEPIRLQGSQWFQMGCLRFLLVIIKDANIDLRIAFVIILTRSNM